MKRSLFTKNSFTKARTFKNAIVLVVAVSVAALGIYALSSTHAASPYVSSEAESGNLGSNGLATIQDSSSASSGKYVQFGSSITRDPLLWPFAQDSPWNMPIGSNAQYVNVGLTTPGNVSTDIDYFVTTTSSDPQHTIYQPGADGFTPPRCSGTATEGAPEINFPNGTIIPDASSGNTPNNAGVVLQPDGRTLVEMGIMARCQSSGNIYGWYHCEENIETSLGIAGGGETNCNGNQYGGHAGSGLSAIGGAIRNGELLGTGTIHHALQLELDASMYYYYSSSEPGYRWPAGNADGYASSGYHGSNPALTEGSLLAIPPDVTAASLHLTTPAGQKLFAALQDYGGYAVEDTAWDDFQIGMESQAATQFSQTYGYDFDSSTMQDDLDAIFTHLEVVNNNSPTSIGGGGTQRENLAPPFSD